MLILIMGGFPLTDTSTLVNVIASLISADNNASVDQINQNISNLKAIKEKLPSEYESFISRIDKGISILENDLKYKENQ